MTLPRPWRHRLRTVAHLGVAIGKHWINLALVTRRGDGFEVAATRILASAERAALGRVIGEMGARGTPATFSVVDKDFHHRTVTVPPLSARHMARVVAREAGAGPGDAVAWTALRERPDRMRDVEVRALPRGEVEALAREAAEAGVALSDVVPHATSFITAMTRPGDRESGDLISLIEVWDHNADLVLARYGAHVYDRHMNRGSLGRHGEESVAPAPEPEAPSVDDFDFGVIDLAIDNAIDGAIDNAAGGAAEDAEERAVADAVADAIDGAIDAAIGGPEPGPAAVAPAPPAEAPPPAAPPVSPAWERLAEEVLRTHLYAKKNLKAGDVARVVLSGPMAEDPAFVEWLGGQVRAEVVPHLRYRDDVAWRGEPDARMVVAMGAALSGLGLGGRGTSLVPEELRRRNVPNPLSHAAAALLACALISAGLGVVYQARAVDEEAARVTALQGEIARARDARAAPRGPAPLVTPDGAHHPLPDGAPGAFPATDLLRDLGTAMPPRARLLSAGARWEDGAWRVTARGEVLAPAADALAAVGALVEALAATGRFRAVDLSPVKAGGDATPFTIDLVLDGGGRAGPA